MGMAGWVCAGSGGFSDEMVGGVLVPRRLKLLARPKLKDVDGAVLTCGLRQDEEWKPLALKWV